MKPGIDPVATFAFAPPALLHRFSLPVPACASMAVQKATVLPATAMSSSEATLPMLAGAPPVRATASMLRSVPVPLSV